MIIHSQIIDSKSKRSLADFTVQIKAGSLNIEEISSKCEEFSQVVSEFDMTTTPNRLHNDQTNVINYFG